MNTPVPVRKRPVLVHAMQWDGTAEGATPIIDWILASESTARYVCANPGRCVEFDGDSPHWIAIDTLEGTMQASVGWWIIRGVRGEFYPCEPEIFAETYDVASEPVDG